MRLITTITHEQQRAKIYRHEDEYIVRFYDHATYLEEADYFTDNREDAVNTAEIQIGLKPL
jgi:hypothetical protein